MAGFGGIAKILQGAGAAIKAQGGKALRAIGGAVKGGDAFLGGRSSLTGKAFKGLTKPLGGSARAARLAVLSGRKTAGLSNIGARTAATRAIAGGGVGGAFRIAAGAGSIFFLFQILGMLQGDRNTLSPSVLLGLDITEEEKKDLEKEIERLNKSKNKKAIARQLIEDQFGPEKSDIDKLGLSAGDAIDFQTSERLIPLLAETGQTAEDVLGPEVRQSRLLSSLTSREEDNLRQTLQRETADLDSFAKDFFAGR